MIGPQLNHQGPYWWIDAKPPETASYKEADGNWFAAHGQRGFCVRRPLPGEPLPSSDITHVVLKQRLPGIREKSFLVVPDMAFGSIEIPNNEHVGMAIWQLLESGSEKIPLLKIKRLAASLARLEPKVRQ